MRALLVVGLLAGCGRIGFDPVCGLDGPCVSAVTINGGALYAPGPRLAVGVTVTGDIPAIDVRVTAGPCSFADDGWQPYDAATTYPVLVEPVDGAKQVCAWARSATGTLSAVRTATITYETANLPVVESFDVVTLDATHLRATWTVSDVEGLAATPIDLEVTTNGTTWDPLATGVGAGPMGSVDLPAPSGPYIVRLTVTDRAGNRGVRGFSDLINAPGWSIYAGSPDHAIGAAARSLELQFAENSSYMFAVDPATLDAYAWDRDTGIIRIDGATGQTEKLFGNSNTNLPDDGQLPADATVQFDPSLQFGPDGMLYVSAGRGTAELNSAVIYQLDPRTRHVRRYVGGGTGIDATATPATVFVSKWVWTFDEDGSLYFLTSCTPGSEPSPNRMRLMKVTRQPDGTAGTLSVVAGNCIAGTVPPGVDATMAPLGVFTSYAGIGSLAVFDHGRAIYIASYPGVARKILDGLTSATDLPIDTTGSLAYDARTGQILVGDGAIRAFIPNRTGPTEQPAGIVVAETGTGACAEDGAPASDACVHVGFTMQSTPDRLYFSDGEALNEHRTYRVRFVDRNGLVRTYAGGMPVHGVGLPRRFARARFSGIAYKPASAPNQSAFPAGLYFADPFGVVLGRVDEATERVSIVWGNQSGTPRAYTTGDPIGPDVTLGTAYAGGTLRSLGLDAQGIPIVRYGRNEGHAHLISADASGHAVVLQNGTTLWENAPDGTDPTQLEMWPYGALSNISMAGQIVFVLGGYSSYNTTATLRSLDFGASRTTRLMGAGTDAVSPDTATPANASLSPSCHADSYDCFTQYRAADDRLYFSEENRLRYLTTPRNPATAALGTLFTLAAADRVYNFTFRPDGSQVFYEHNGLRCHDISSGQPYCNDAPLGPPVVIGPYARGPDELTWRDNNTLLFSTYSGYVLQYTLP